MIGRLMRVNTGDREPIPGDELPEGGRLLPLGRWEDERGATLDLLRSEAALLSGPLVYAHAFTVLPGRAKGWGRHADHDDRYALLRGAVEVALFDARPSSRTSGSGFRVQLSREDRGLLLIPRGVWHATRCVSTEEAIVIDCPTRPYCHEAPDKFTLPLDTDEIPFVLGPDWHGH